MPKNTALLVVDVQNAFRPDTPAALPNILTLCKYFLKNKLPVIFIQHGHTKAEIQADPPTNQIARKWGPNGSVEIETERWKIVDELIPFLPQYPKPLPEIGACFPEATSDEFPKVVFKNTYDSFINTKLSDILTAAKIKRVLVSGVVTDCCCDKTARSAFNHGYETWMIGDACGTVRQEQHDAFLKGFAFAFGDVLSTEEALKAIAK